MDTRNSILVVETDQTRLFESLNRYQGPKPLFQTKQSRFSEARQTLAEGAPEVVILDVEYQKTQAREILDEFRRRNPQTYWVLSGTHLDGAELVDFMRRGVMDFLKTPLSEDDFERFKQRVREWETGHNTENGGSAHTMISVFSGKGGVGQSLVAVNIAATLAAQNPEKRVALVDFVLQHGNVAELLDMNSQYTLFDLTENLDRLDKKLMETSIKKHTSGVYVLPSPKQIDESERFTSQDAEAPLKALKETFDYVVLDVGHELTMASISCLDQSDKVVLLTTPDLASLCSTKVTLNNFKQLGYKPEKVKLVLNRWQMKYAIDTAVIEKNLQYAISHQLMDDPALALQAVNQGVPLAAIQKKAKLVKHFEALAADLSPIQAGTDPS